MLFALSDEKYLKIAESNVTDESVRLAKIETYMSSVRKSIAETIYPACLKQELFDYTDDEISNMLQSPLLHFDSKIFFRAIEEYFKINLFVFEPSGETETVFEYPQYAVFPIRRFDPDRPVILIYKSYRSVRPTSCYITI